MQFELNWNPENAFENVLCEMAAFCRGLNELIYESFT